MAGWIFKSQKKGRGELNKYRSDNVKTKNRHITEVARASDEGGGMGASVLYRDRIKSGYYVTEKGKLIAPKKVPPTKPEFIKKYTNGQDPVGILELLETRYWQSDRRSGYDHWHYYKALNLKFTPIYCCFSGVKAIFVQVDALKQEISISEMCSTERARHIVSTKKFHQIMWKETRSIPEPPVQHPE